MKRSSYPPQVFDEMEDETWRAVFPNRVFRVRMTRPDDFGPERMMADRFNYTCTAFCDQSGRTVTSGWTTFDEMTPEKDTDLWLFREMMANTRWFEPRPADRIRQTLCNAFRNAYGFLPQ